MTVSLTPNFSVVQLEAALDFANEMPDFCSSSTALWPLYVNQGCLDHVALLMRLTP